MLRVESRLKKLKIINRNNRWSNCLLDRLIKPSIPINPIWLMVERLARTCIYFLRTIYLSFNISILVIIFTWTFYIDSNRGGKKIQKMGNMYVKWLVMSRTGLRKSKHNGQASFINIYAFNKYTKQTTENKTKITFARLYFPTFILLARTQLPKIPVYWKGI